MDDETIKVLRAQGALDARRHGEDFGPLPTFEHFAGFCVAHKRADLATREHYRVYLRALLDGLLDAVDARERMNLTTQDLGTCPGCGWEHVVITAPALTDHAGWKTVRANHHPECVWIATRGLCDERFESPARATFAYGMFAAGMDARHGGPMQERRWNQAADILAAHNARARPLPHWRLTHWLVVPGIRPRAVMATRAGEHVWTDAPVGVALYLPEELVHGETAPAYYVSDDGVLWRQGAPEPEGWSLHRTRPAR